MNFYPIGLVIALSSVFASIRVLGQNFEDYFDIAALMVVFGGTLAVTLITIPWEYRVDIANGVKALIKKYTAPVQDVLEECLNFAQLDPQGGYAPKESNHLYHKILADGSELIGLGLPADQIQQVLGERVYQHTKRQKKVATAIKNLAKYPPAFGLLGTVFGLVSIMQGISQGADTRTTAAKMAISLVAIAYGLLISNLFIIPAAETIVRTAEEEEFQGELAVSAVLLTQERTPILETQELLNSYVTEENRVNIYTPEEEEIHEAA